MVEENVGRYSFKEDRKEPGEFDLFISFPGIPSMRGWIYIVNYSNQDLYFLDSEGNSQKVLPNHYIPFREGEKFRFKEKWYTLDESSPRPQPLNVLDVNSINAQIINSPNAQLFLDAGVFFNVKPGIFSNWTGQEKIVEFPIYLDPKTGLITALGEPPEDIKMTSHELIVKVMLPPRGRDQSYIPTIINIDIPDTASGIYIREIAKSLEGKTITFPDDIGSGTDARRTKIINLPPLNQSPYR
jgi:hypothetical protein